jgi:hypothetical protein
MAINAKRKAILNRLQIGSKIGDILYNLENPFVSTEQTGNAAQQDIAHGLGSTPRWWFVEVTATASGANTFVKGTADGTNCPVTATTGSKYRVIAFK